MGSSIRPDNTSEDDLYKEIYELKQERDAYKTAALHAGVCPTCVIQAPEPYGCSDCLNTGWMQGDPYEEIKTLEAKLTEANKALERLGDMKAFTKPRIIGSPEFKEVEARCEFARSTRRAHSKDGGEHNG